MLSKIHVMKVGFLICERLKQSFKSKRKFKIKISDQIKYVTTEVLDNFFLLSTHVHC